jgi:hypothetical protein
MNAVTLLIVLGMLLTIVALGTGIGSMMRGGKYDDKHSGDFMMLRVGAQGATLVVLLIALIVANL